MLLFVERAGSRFVGAEVWRSASARRIMPGTLRRIVISTEPSDDQAAEDSFATGLSKLSVAIPATVSTQVLESQEHLESILVALWPCEWMALPLLSKTTHHICKELGHRCAERHGIRSCRPTGCRSPLRTLAATAHVYLFGGMEDSTMARHVYVLPADAAASGSGDAGGVDEEQAGRDRYVLQVKAEGRLRLERRFTTRAEAADAAEDVQQERGHLWPRIGSPTWTHELPEYAQPSVHDSWGLLQLPLPPLPDTAHADEIAAAAAGGCLYITSDSTRQLAPGQAWNWPEDAAPYLTHITEQEAYTARYDIGVGAWGQVAAPPPPDERHATPKSGCLGSYRGALVHTGGSSLALTQGRTPGDEDNLSWPWDSADMSAHSSRAAHRLDAGGRWVPLPSMVLCRRNHSLCEHGGYLYAAGGCPRSVPPEARYHRSIERFDGERWERLEDVPLCAPFEQQEVVFSLQLLVCAGALHAILIGFDTLTDHAADDDPDLFDLVCGYETAPVERPFALFRRDEAGGWTRVVPTGAQPGSRLLGSPVVAHADRILIFGMTHYGAPCVHALLLEGGQLASCRWLPPQELLWDGPEPDSRTGRIVPRAGPSEWTAGVALAVALR